MSATELASLITSIVAIAGFIAVWRKIQPENRKTDSDTIANLNDALDKAIARAEKLQARQDIQDDKMDKLESRLRVSNAEAGELRDKLHDALENQAKFQYWAKLLYDQIIMQFNGTPANLEFSEKKRKGTA